MHFELALISEQVLAVVGGSVALSATRGGLWSVMFIGRGRPFLARLTAISQREMDGKKAIQISRLRT